MTTRGATLEAGKRQADYTLSATFQAPLTRKLVLALLLLSAFFLRTWSITAIPPGLTHDEANHGREAIGILKGNLALFFPLNYGSEPLYSYTVAALMVLIGRGLLALRLVTVYFGLLALSVTYLFGRLAFGRSTGLLATALMAFSFWPLASSREALRAGMMPFFTAAAMVFFWLLVQRARVGPETRKPAFTRRHYVPVAGMALCLAATLYNYLAARVLWLVFPLFLLYLGRFHRERLRRLWPSVAVALLLTALLVTPMFIYLQQHPEAQTRLQMFGVLDDLLQGNVLPLLETAGRALLAFVWPNAGDRFLAYNLPGRPTLALPTALFFVLGLALSLWRWRKPRYAFLLLWFLIGVAPSLLTGATANTTRNVGAMPPTFLLPAVAFVELTKRRASFSDARRRVARWAIMVLVGLWLALVLYSTASDYFLRWARTPEVRAAYMHTLVQELRYVEAHSTEGVAMISSELPGPAHNQSIGLVFLPEARNLRWVDARHALIFPPEETVLLAPASAPPHPVFLSWLQPLHTRQLQAEDLDPSFTIYGVHAQPELPHDESEATFGVGAPALTLVGSYWLVPQVRAGEIAALLQVWRIDDPAGVGPTIAALDGSDVVLFTHLLGETGNILAQDDRLDAPSSSWQAGDTVVQVHRLQVPQETAPGVYTAVAGIYDRASQQPLPLFGEQGSWDATRAIVDSLNVIP